MKLNVWTNGVKNALLSVHGIFTQYILQSNTVYDIIAEEITTSYKEYKSMRLGEL